MNPNVATSRPRRALQVRIATLMIVVAIAGAASWLAREVRSGEPLSLGAQIVVGLGLPLLGMATILALVGLILGASWLMFAAGSRIAAATAGLRRMRR